MCRRVIYFLHGFDLPGALGVGAGLGVGGDDVSAAILLDAVVVAVVVLDAVRGLSKVAPAVPCVIVALRAYPLHAVHNAVAV